MTGGSSFLATTSPNGSYQSILGVNAVFNMFTPPPSLSWSLDSQTKVPEVGVRSEQATEHSAPSPSFFAFELNPIVSVFAAELRLFGPLLWQNLVNSGQ